MAFTTVTKGSRRDDQLDTILANHNNEHRAHSGKYCFGKTPLETFRDSAHLAQAKMLDRLTVTDPSDIGRQRAEPERSHAERSGGVARISAA